jgi:DNA-binding MarR family transcriptional regulator
MKGSEQLFQNLLRDAGGASGEANHQQPSLTADPGDKKMSRTKKMTLGLSATALALVGGIGVAGVASATTTPAPAPSTSSSASADGSTSTAPGGGMGKHGGRGGERGIAQASALAEKLGVDEAKVTEALQAFREANKPTTPPTEGAKPDQAARDAALAKSLAESLGIEESTVTAALEELRTEKQAEKAAALKTRLDQAVADGKLTQAEADAVTKAIENGVIGGGR